MEVLTIMAPSDALEEELRLQKEREQAAEAQKVRACPKHTQRGPSR